MDNPEPSPFSDVSLGFKEDCIKLISLLQDNENFNFQTFCHVWKVMEFSNVFVERMVLAELVEFCEETLEIAKEFISSGRSFEDRISGIYLLYALFFRMPLRPQPQIRMTFLDWQHLMELKNHLIKEHLYLDAVFIINKLRKANAFAYCLCEKNKGLEEYFDEKDGYGYEDDAFNDDNNHTSSERPRNIELTQIFKDINQKSKNYIDKKTVLRKNGSVIPRLYDLQAVEDIVSKMVDLERSPREKRQHALSEKRNRKTSVSS